MFRLSYFGTRFIISSKHDLTVLVSLPFWELQGVEEDRPYASECRIHVVLRRCARDREGNELQRSTRVRGGEQECGSAKVLIAAGAGPLVLLLVVTITP